jgi:formylglycine-generating enzyme required for sulfatase activity
MFPLKLLFSSMLFLLISNPFITMCFATEKQQDKSCRCNKTPNRFAASSSELHAGMVQIPDGTFMMGGDNHQAKKDEFPKHKVTVNRFWMDIQPVTNAQFQEFVNLTKYITTAEQKPDWEKLKHQALPNTPKPDEKLLVPASLVFTPLDHAVPLNDPTLWWVWIPGADWKHPHGPQSKFAGLDHPVVQVSWDDANAYCKSQHKRLPTEAEWEWAARGGLDNKIYPWGNEPINEGAVKANTWQGEFPYHNTLQDQFYYTSPVGTYAPNGYGLYDMAGNVWEWVADWYRNDYYSTVKDGVSNPQGPTSSYDPEEPHTPKKVLRGGSFLCDESYCAGYRVSARMRTSPDTSMEHLGFRCVCDH